MYLLFTSGSTGRPKGVPIYYSCLNSYLDVLTGPEVHDFSASDRFLQMFDLTFDFSVMALFTPLSLGASCFVVPERGFVYMNIIKILTEQEITVAPMVPSALAYMSRFFPELHLQSLRFSIFCGEALPQDLVSKWAGCVPNARIQNCYGPTEATVYCLAYDWHPVTSAPEAIDGIVPIGKPMPDTSVVLINEHQERVAPHERGELCLSGPQVTNQYWRDPEKTQAAFFFDSNLEGSGPYYRTGDICLLNEQGNYLYCGRKDFQVKIDGHRIELGEIEHHAREYTGEPLVAAVAVEVEPGRNSLFLFVKGDGDVSGLEAHLQSKLPVYMYPRRIFTLQELPLNLNGKIDRPALQRLIKS